MGRAERYLKQYAPGWAVRRCIKPELVHSLAPSASTLSAILWVLGGLFDGQASFACRRALRR